MTKILIVSGRFYEDIASELESGAVATLQERGVDFDIIAVPGVFEIPAAIGFAVRKYDAFVALGCVIRGETSHYDYVCGESARGLMDLGLQKGCAIGYGILTVENEDQAWERARVMHGNKGRDAALAALRMVELKKQFA
jgi:6,7-dimethyl-8-ribityllumazine synthase